MIVGNLELQFSTNVARITTEVGQIRGALSNATRDMNQMLAGLRTAFGALGVGLSVGGIVAMFKSIADAGDEAVKSAQKAGLGVEAWQRYDYAAKLAGVSSEQLGKGLKGLGDFVNQVTTGSAEATDMFKRLGVGLRDASGNVKSADALLLDMAERFQRMPEGLEKTTAATKVFGRAGMELLPFLNQGRAGIEELTKEADRLGIVMDTKAAIAAEALNDNMSRMGAAVRGVFVQGIAPLLPFMEKMSAAMVKSTAESGHLGASAGALAGSLKVIGSVVLIVKGTFEALGTMIGGIAAAISMLFTDSMNPRMFANIGATLQQTFADVGAIADRNKASLGELWNGMAEGAAKATPPMQALGRTTLQSAEAIAAAKEAARELGLEWDAGYDKLKRWHDELKAARLSMERMERDFGKRAEEITFSIVSGIADTAGAAVDAGLQVHDALMRPWQQLSTVAGDFFADLVMNGRLAFDNLKNYLKQFLAELIKVFATRWILQMGASMAGGGGSGLGGTLASAASSYGQNTMMGGVASMAGNYLGSTAVGQFWGGMTGSIAGPAMPGSALSYGQGAAGYAGIAGIVAIIVAAMIANDRFFGQGWRADDQDGITDAPGGPLTGDRILRGLGLNDRWASLISGSSLHTRLWGRRQTQADAAGLRGTVTGSTFAGEGWQDFSQAGGTFRSDRRWQESMPLGAQGDLLGSLMERVNGVTRAFADMLGVGMESALQGFSASFEAQLTANGEYIGDVAAGQLLSDFFGTVLRDQAALIFDAADEDFLAEYVRAIDGTGDQITARVRELLAVMQGLEAINLTGLDVEALMAFAQEGETLGQTFERVAGAWLQLEDSFTSTETKLANAAAQLLAFEGTLNAAGIQMPVTREAWLDVMRGLDLSTESGRTLFATMINLAPAFDTVQAAGERMHSRWMSISQLLDRYNGGTDLSFAVGQFQRNTGGAGESVEQLIARLRTITQEDLRNYTEENQLLIEAILRLGLNVENLGQSIGRPSMSPPSPHETEFERYYRERQAREGAQGGMRGWLDSLITGQDSVLDPTQRLSEAQRQYEEILALAQGGDLAAMGKLQGSADSYLRLAREMFGSSSRYVDIFNSVFKAVSGVAGAPDLNERMLSTQVDILEVLLQIRDQGGQQAAMVAGVTEESGEKVSRTVRSASREAVRR